MHICIFEDTSVLNFEPLTYTRPVYDLFCGTRTLKEKILSHFPGAEYSLFCRDYLVKNVEQNNPGINVNKIPSGDVIFINGRVIADDNFDKSVIINSPRTVFVKNNFVAAANLSGEAAGNFIKSGFVSAEGVSLKEADITLADYIWDLIYANGKEITREINTLLKEQTQNIKGEVFDGVYFISKENVYIEEGAKIKPGTVIDASGGPVYIGRNTLVYPNCVIEGPVFIGANSLIKAGAKIYPAVSIGDVCKVGGEVEDAIIMSYSNKQHEGFIGHAYLGNWVNLGADTNCSDLRNNYGPVKAFVNGKEINTGKQFLGLIMGDHSKTGINTMFNTGTTAGVSCNIYGAGFPDKNIVSFAWGKKDAFVTYDIDKAIDTAKKVTARRKKDFTAADEDLFRCIFDMSKEERLRKGYEG